MDLSGEARLHEGEVLVGQGDIEEAVSPDFTKEGRGLFDIVSIDLCGLDLDSGGRFDIRGEGIAFRESD